MRFNFIHVGLTKTSVDWSNSFVPNTKLFVFLSVLSVLSVGSVF